MLDLKEEEVNSPILNKKTHKNGLEKMKRQDNQGPV